MGRLSDIEDELYRQEHGDPVHKEFWDSMRRDPAADARIRKSQQESYDRHQAQLRGEAARANKLPEWLKVEDPKNWTWVAGDCVSKTVTEKKHEVTGYITFRPRYLKDGRWWYDDPQPYIFTRKGAYFEEHHKTVKGAVSALERDSKSTLKSMIAETERKQEKRRKTDALIEKMTQEDYDLLRDHFTAR